MLYRLRNKQKHYLISLVFSILSNISNNSDFLKVFLSFLLNFQRLFLVTSGTFFLFSSSSAVIFCRSCSLSSSYQYVNSKKWRWPKNEEDLKNEDNLKNEDDLKIEDNLKNEDDLKNEDNLKNENDLKNEDDIKIKMTLKMRTTSKIKMT